MRKKALSLALALMLCLCLAAPAFAADGDFVIENGVLTKYNGPGGDVAIPNGVTSIGDDAFFLCSGLTSVTIPDSVTSIGDSAFWSCYSLTSVTIPNSVTSIGASAFGETPWLTGLGEFAIANGILLAYQGNSSSVTIPSSVTSIGKLAFSACDNITGVTIPDSVTSIGDGAFEHCHSLTSATIPSSVTSIGGGAFGACTNLSSIQVDANNQSYCSVDGIVFSKDMKTFAAYPSGKRGAYYIPNSVISIGKGAFAYCTGLTGVTIPSSVASIGEGAFFECESLTDVCYVGTEAQWKTIKIDYANNPLLNAAIHCNSAAPDTPSRSETASPTNDKLTVNGVLQSPAVYKIGGSNFFKIRDLAAMLSGSEKQFDVGYDGALKSVTLTTGKGYAKQSGDMAGAAAGGNQTANPSNDTIYINGRKIDVTVYKIGGSNYFKLRDLGKALGFYVGWTAKEGVFIDTSKPYSD